MIDSQPAGDRVLRVIGPGAPGTPVRMVTEGDAVRLDPTDETPTAYLSPGWIDLHAHVYDGVTELGVHADRVGLATGVHVVADAGSAGAFTVDGLARYVIPAFLTEVVAWLNIGARGLVDMFEVSDVRRDIDLDKAIASVERHRNLVRGIKVRASGLVVGNMGMLPLELGLVVADAVQLPLMVHIGEPPPTIDQILRLLRPGDVVTHCFHGKPGHPWMADGRPRPGLREALDRGVLLDVGHGYASFSADIGQAAIQGGITPDTISTDAHVMNVDGPVYDLATTMTKFLHLGMDLPAIIDAVTTTPASVLGLHRPSIEGNVVREGTIFEIVDGPGDRVYRDSGRQPMTVGQRIVPLAVVTGGRYLPCPQLVDEWRHTSAGEQRSAERWPDFMGPRGSLPR